MSTLVRKAHSFMAVTGLGGCQNGGLQRKESGVTQGWVTAAKACSSNLSAPQWALAAKERQE